MSRHEEKAREILGDATCREPASIHTPPLVTRIATALREEHDRTTRETIKRAIEECNEHALRLQRQGFTQDAEIARGCARAIRSLLATEGGE